MRPNTKKEIKDRTKHAYGLLNVLRFDIDILRKDASDFNLDKLDGSVRETKITLHKLLLVIKELEEIIDISRNEQVL